MWQQIYDPFGNMIISTALAAIPVVVMLVALGFLHIKAHVAAGLGLLAAGLQVFVVPQACGSRRPEDKALTAQIREGQGKIFSEDLEMLERQQKNLSAFPERALLKLNIDTGGVQSRKVIERVIAVEKGVAT